MLTYQGIACSALVALTAGCVSTSFRDRDASTPATRQISFPADAEIHAMLKEIVPEPKSHGMIVGLLEPDGRRRIIAHGSEGPGGRALDAGSVLEIGSVSKVFLGVLLADMVRRREVELDEPVQRLLPAQVRVPVRNGKHITLLDLATHTSGLPPMPGNFPTREGAHAYANYSMEKLFEWLSDYELPRDPGATFEYSNVITLLGHALSLRAGAPYEALLRERVLGPLQLKHTSITLTPNMERRMTRGTNAAGDPQPYFVAPAFVASGGLKSTMSDMLEFAAANLTPADTRLHAVLRDSRRARRAIDQAGDSMALGWGAENGTAGLSGGTFGFGSYLLVDPARRRAVVVLSNIAGRESTLLGVHLMYPERFSRPKR